MTEIGVQFHEGKEHEVPHENSGMGKNEFVRLEADVSAQKQVEVDDARAVLPNHLFAQILLDGLELLQ